jgi:hypothetical protein
MTPKEPRSHPLSALASDVAPEILLRALVPELSNRVVMAGLVPAIPLRWTLSSDDRDARVKPAHDAREGRTFPGY